MPAYVVATLAMTLLGVGIAAAMRARAARPSATFLVIGIVGTLLSLVQPVLLAADTATAVVLNASHIAAAAVILPLIARALPATRQ